MVQTNTVEGPGSEGGVIRIKGTNRGLAMALDGNGRWCYLDPKLGAMHAVAESARNVACTGATPDRGDELPELRQSREAAHHVAVLAGHRRHDQSLRGAGDADHRRQRQLLQRDPGRRHLPDAGHGHRRHHGGRSQGRRPALPASRARAGRAPRLRAGRRAPTPKPSSAPPNTPRRSWASSGASRRRWNWTESPACKRRSSR